jgi:hypothetical protein
MTWTDNSYYEGEWVNGIQHGLGKMVLPNGTVKEGYFENNHWVRSRDEQAVAIPRPSIRCYSPHMNQKSTAAGSPHIKR